MRFLSAAKPSMLHSHRTSSADFRYCAAVSLVAALEVLGVAEGVVGGYLGLVRSAFGDVKNDLLDGTGIPAGVTVGVREERLFASAEGSVNVAFATQRAGRGPGTSLAESGCYRGTVPGPMISRTVPSGQWKCCQLTPSAC
jgi:hypothetical protein